MKRLKENNSYFSKYPFGKKTKRGLRNEENSKRKAKGPQTNKYESLCGLYVDFFSLSPYLQRCLSEEKTWVGFSALENQTKLPRKRGRRPLIRSKLKPLLVYLCFLVN